MYLESFYVCVFLTRNAEGDLFASLIEQHLLELEEKPFHIFSLSYPAFLWSPLPPPLPTCVTGADFCPGRSARHSCGTSFWALQHCWCISAVVFSFSCWISGNHAVIEAGKDLWDPGVQPLITILSTDTWVLYKKSLPLLPLKSLKYLCNAALGTLWPFIKEVPAALEQNQGLCPRRRKRCSQERLLNLKRVKQLLVSMWISVGGSLCDCVLAPVSIPEGAQVWRAVPAVPVALGESFSFHPCGILECCTQWCWELLFPGSSSRN